MKSLSTSTSGLAEVDNTGYKSKPMCSSVIKGFLSGSLIVGSLINPYGMPVQLFMLIVGLVMIFDALFVFGRDCRPVTTMLSCVLGAIVVSVFTIISCSGLYLAVVFALIILVYACSLLRRQDR
jgi:hypothetical protein